MAEPPPRARTSDECSRDHAHPRGAEIGDEGDMLEPTRSTGTADVRRFDPNAKIGRRLSPRGTRRLVHGIHTPFRVAVQRLR